MPIYSYRAKNQSGQLIEGAVDAVSEDAIAALLNERGLSVIAITKQNSADFDQRVLKFLNRVKVKEKVVFFRQLAVMMEASLPIVKALRILIRQTGNKYFKFVISSIADEVDGGAKMSQAMARFPDVFTDFYINIIASGETSGRLSEVLEYLANQQEKDYDLQSKVKGAMIYPAFILSALLLVSVVMMIFVVPQMTSMLKESGVQLPLATKIFLGTSDFLINYWFWLMIGAVIAVASFFFLINKTAIGRRSFDLFKIKAPIFGTIAKNIYIVRITRSLSTLLIGGVPVAKALRVVKNVVGNTVYEELLDMAIKDVDEGTSLTDSLMKDKNLPVLVSQMISVGEETGKLDVVLEKVTAFYTKEIDNSVANLATMIEPVVMIVLGVVIGGFVAAVITPMWQLSASF